MAKRKRDYENLEDSFSNISSARKKRKMDNKDNKDGISSFRIFSPKKVEKTFSNIERNNKFPEIQKTNYPGFLKTDPIFQKAPKTSPENAKLTNQIEDAKAEKLHQISKQKNQILLSSEISVEENVINEQLDEIDEDVLDFDTILSFQEDQTVLTTPNPILETPIIKEKKEVENINTIQITSDDELKNKIDLVLRRKENLVEHVEDSQDLGESLSQGEVYPTFEKDVLVPVRPPISANVEKGTAENKTEWIRKTISVCDGSSQTSISTRPTLQTKDLIQNLKRALAEKTSALNNAKVLLQKQKEEMNFHLQNLDRELKITEASVSELMEPSNKVEMRQNGRSLNRNRNSNNLRKFY